MRQDVLGQFVNRLFGRPARYTKVEHHMGNAQSLVLFPEFDQGFPACVNATTDT